MLLKTREEKLENRAKRVERSSLWGSEEGSIGRGCVLHFVCLPDLHSVFQVSQGCRARPCLKNKEKTKESKTAVSQTPAIEPQRKKPGGYSFKTAPHPN